MERTGREKLALVVFALGIVGAIMTAIAYMIIGHSWNVAASHIDVSIDALDRFDVVVYEGMSTRYFADDDEPLSAQERKLAESARFATESVVEKYRDAGASVLLLDAANPERYREGLVLLRDGVRFGVMSVDESDTKEEIAQKVEDLSSKGVRMIIALVPYKMTLNGISGVDVAICLNDPLSQYVKGKNVEGTFFVSPPKQDGSVGAVLMSSNDVALSKNFYKEKAEVHSSDAEADGDVGDEADAGDAAGASGAADPEASGSDPSGSGSSDAGTGKSGQSQEG